MTRDEFVRRWEGMRTAAGFADLFIEVGMLKLEEPKGPNEKFSNAWEQYNPGLSVGRVFQALSAVGLKIVEK